MLLLSNRKNVTLSRLPIAPKFIYSQQYRVLT